MKATKIYLFILLILFSISAMVAILYFEKSYQDRFYPNVIIGEESVGGKTYKEVLEKAETFSKKVDAEGFHLLLNAKRGKREVTVPVSSRGLTADTVVEYFSLGDWEKILQEAYAWGRNGSIVKRLWEQMSLVRNKVFALPYAIRQEAISSLLNRELESFLKRPKPAQFVIDSGNIAIAPEKPGEQIDNDEVIEAISGAMGAMTANSIEFSGRAAASPLTAKELEPFLDPIRNFARSSTAAFSYNGRRWYVSGNNFATWLTLKGEKTLGIDPEKLREFLVKNVTPLVDDPPINSRFQMQNGKLVEIVPGRAGNVVDIIGTERKVDKVIKEIQNSFALKDPALELASLLTEATYSPKTGIIIIPIEIIREIPKVTKETIDRYNIKELAGIARTSFAGSSDNRRHNIEIGVSKLNGILIAPGEEFSTVKAIGLTTEEEGFVKEYVIKEDRSIKEAGGGLCQIATTLFRLALNAGLPIAERKNHRYVVGYYGPGLDATIYGPSPDLKFINDTDGYLLLQGRVEGNELILEFYGQKDGRTATLSDITLSDPVAAPDAKYVASPDLPFGQVQCSETPRAGITAKVTYTVSYPEGENKTQVFESVYQPWQKICLIGIEK